MWAVIIAIAAFLVGLMLFFGVGLKTGNKDMGKFFGVLLFATALISGLVSYGTIDLQSVTSTDGTPTGQNLVDAGDTATFNVNAYDEEHTSQLEVYPLYSVYVDGVLAIDGANLTSDSTIAAVGDRIDIYGASEDGSYYVDARESIKVTKRTQTETIDAHDIAAESNLQITCFDDTLTALTADNNANNTANYTLGDLGASETKDIVCRFKNSEATSLHQLGAICVGWGNDVDELELTDSGWKLDSRGVPKELDDASVVVTVDSGTNQSGVSWKECYVPDNADKMVKFEEYDQQYFDFVVTAGSTAPTANTGDVAIIGFFDAAWEKGDDGLSYFDYYVHDEDEEVSDVGLAESTVTTATGRQTAVQLEAQ